MALLGKKYIDNEQNSVMHICIGCAICTAFLYFLSAFSSGIYVGRLPIFTTLQGYAAVPWIIERTFNAKSARIIKMGLVVGFLAFFYYQMHIAWGIL